MNAQDSKQNEYTLLDDRVGVELYPFFDSWVVYCYTVDVYGEVVSSTRKAYNTYDEALNAYNQACASQSFLPDHCTSESGQIIGLFLLALICIAFVLYLCYTGISQLAGCTNEGGLFEAMLNGLEEVIR